MFMAHYCAAARAKYYSCINLIIQGLMPHAFELLLSCASFVYVIVHFSCIFIKLNGVVTHRDEMWKREEKCNILLLQNVTFVA
jgi:hypothetical protein